MGGKQSTFPPRAGQACTARAHGKTNSAARFGAAQIQHAQCTLAKRVDQRILLISPNFNIKWLIAPSLLSGLLLMTATTQISIHLTGRLGTDASLRPYNCERLGSVTSHRL